MRSPLGWLSSVSPVTLPPHIARGQGTGVSLLHVLDLGAIGLVVADEERLQRRRELVAVEVALLVCLHVGGALPQTHREARVLVLRVLEQPAPAQPFDLAALDRHRLPIRLLEVVPRAGPEL